MSYLISEKQRQGILHVDDHPLVLDGFRILLEGEGYSNLHQAKNGMEALNLLKEKGSEIHLILLDISMPKMNGLDFMKHLMNCIDFPVAVIAVTMHDVEEFGKSFFDLCNDNVLATYYFNKCSKRSELFTEINNSLDRVYDRRRKQLDKHLVFIYQQLEKLQNITSLNKEISDLHSLVKHVSRKQPTFLAQLGMDVIRTIILAIMVLAFLHFGVSDFVKNIIK